MMVVSGGSNDLNFCTDRCMQVESVPELHEKKTAPAIVPKRNNIHNQPSKQHGQQSTGDITPTTTINNQRETLQRRLPLCAGGPLAEDHC
jgi:hypothetical protein